MSLNTEKIVFLYYEKYAYLLNIILSLRLFLKEVKTIEMDAIKFIEDQLLTNNNIPVFRPGDNVEVSYRIVEGTKERIQIFRGDVIKINGEGARKTFTVRKMSSGVGVERIFPISCPNVAGVKILKKGKVRRAKLYYLRTLVGKKAKIKERTYSK